jgi:adenylate cyclase
LPLAFRRATVANLSAGVLVLLYFQVTGEPPKNQPSRWWADILLAALYGAVLSCVSWRLARREAQRIDAAGPTADVLHVPQRAAVLSMAMWGVVAVTSTVLNYESHLRASQAIRVFLGITLAGLASSFLTALVVERTLRPLFAYVLAGRPPVRKSVLGVRRRLVLFWALGSGLPLAAVLATPIGQSSDSADKVIAGMAVLAAIGLLSGLAFAFVAARSVAEPIADVRQAMDRVASGHLDADLPVDDDGEIGQLQAGFNHMATGLRDRERLREVFGGYVGEDVARQALDAGVSLEGEQREVSVLFVDVIGSTAFAEGASPADVVRLLNAFFEVVIGAVDAEQGWVNKFEGDAALCVFGAPVPQGDHAARALRAATAVRAGLSMLPGLDAGIGVSSGPVVAGNIGSERRYEYTVVGDPVNEAARLTDLAKSHAGRIVVSERTVESAGASGDGWRPGECIILRGRSQPTQTFVPG